MVCLDVADLTEPALKQNTLRLRRRVRKLTALLRLPLGLLRTFGSRLTGARLPDGRAKRRILQAVDKAREHLPLPAVLRFRRIGSVPGAGARPRVRPMISLPVAAPRRID